MPIDPADIALCVADDGPHGPHGSAPASTPIVQTSLFAFPDFQSLLDGLADEAGTHVYTRGQNPTVEAAERKIAALERGEACKCFASGMAAISGVLLGLLEAGDHILFLNQIYGPTRQLARHLERFGIEHDELLDMPDRAALEEAIRPNTRLIFAESPGTMTMQVLDLATVVEVARERNVLTCIDNAWATPLFQKPIPMGFDLVVHTATKYLGGHSDLVAGAVVSSETLMRRIFRNAFLLNGGILGPFDAWLLLRGMRTLPVRMRQHEEDGLAVARFLNAHPKVERVFHPTLTDPELVARQMTGTSGLLSFALKDADFPEVRTFIDALERFRIAVSWGGVESLVISPNNGKRGSSLDRRGIPRGLVRLSLGLEGADTLIADIERALDAV